MKHIRSRKHSNHLHLLALVAATAPAVGMAQQATATLPTVTISETADVPYKADKSANTKYTQPLVDTPQTIQIIKKETFLEQGAATLMEALRNTPGITSQIGENGSLAAGDTFSMRGVSGSQGSLFVDGIRNLGAITRDVYNLDQVEVVKGPAGADIGRGAGAGYINMMTKMPSLEDATSGTATVGSADTKRTTVDYNRKTGEESAIRLNAMLQDSGVPGRDYVKNKGWAFAPSAAWGLGSSTQMYLAAEVLQQHNIPDSGIPAIGINGYTRQQNSSTLTGAAAANIQAINTAGAVSRSNYYGSVNDYEDVEGLALTGKVEHKLADGGTLRNVSRIGRTRMTRISHSPNWIFPNATGSASVFNADPSTWAVSIANQGLDQTNDVVANQTSLNKTLHSGSVQHDIATGVELSYERQRNNTLTNGTTVYQNLYTPNSNLSLPVPTATGAYTDGNTKTAAVYVSDTMKLSPAWQITGAARAERYWTSTDINTITSNVATLSSLSAADTLFSWKLGGVYKPARNGSIYAAVANSQTPPGSSSFALSATASNANNPFLKPQEYLNKEVGTKWDFLDNKLGLAVAVYQTTIRNETPQQQTDGSYVATGDRSVSGIETTMVGALTKNWSVSVGVATMRTEVKEGAGTSLDTSTVGTSARYSPDLTATLWSTWTEGPWSIGGGVRYSAEQKRIIAGTSTGYSMPTLPSYAVYDAMVSYQASKKLTLRLNLYNILDTFYITGTNGNGQQNSGGRLAIGAPRYGTLSASYQF